jgi:hypothetical protein
VPPSPRVGFIEIRSQALLIAKSVSLVATERTSA